MTARRLNAGLAAELRAALAQPAQPAQPAQLGSSQLQPLLRVAPLAPSAGDSSAVSSTEDGTRIVHFGVGAFHRSHLAVYLDDLRSVPGSMAGSVAGSVQWSITGTGVMAQDQAMADVLGEQDGLYIVVEKSGDQATGRIISSISGFSRAVPDSADTIRLLADPSTSIVSLTITEGGYPVNHGAFVPDDRLLTDLAATNPQTTFGIINRALEARRAAGVAPFTVMSCDNLPGNGNVVRTAVLGAAAASSDSLATWLERNGAFPNGMVDRITPATTDADRRFVADTFGVIDGWPVVCEPFRQWALEDVFVSGRPRFEDVGVLMTADVVPYEHMKLRLLNGSHSALAYHAALAGIEYVHLAMADPRIERFVRALMANEAVPTLETPAGIDLVAYQNELVHRFSNPAIADTISRLCLDGTAKFPTFILQTLAQQLQSGGPIDMLTLAIAGWCRYLRGVNDAGKPIVLSNDPNLDEARDAALRSKSRPAAFLEYSRVFGNEFGRSDRLVSRFTTALQSLEAHGSLATLHAWSTASNSASQNAS